MAMHCHICHAYFRQGKRYGLADMETGKTAVICERCLPASVKPSKWKSDKPKEAE